MESEMKPVSATTAGQRCPVDDDETQRDQDVHEDFDIWRSSSWNLDRVEPPTRSPAAEAQMGAPAVVANDPAGSLVITFI